MPTFSIGFTYPLLFFTWSKIENFSSVKSVIKIFFAVVSNSNIDFVGNNPPGISGMEVKRWRFTATLKADPQTWFIIGIKLDWANAETFKYSVIPPNPQTSGWAKYFIFERNLDKENDLYYNVLGLTDDSEFAFISNLYNTDIRDSKFISPEQFDLPVVELQILDGFTLFDWCKVLEKAKKIHTVNTSINYIIDVLDTSCDEYIIYAHDESNKFQIDYLFQKPHKMLCRS